MNSLTREPDDAIATPPVQDHAKALKWASSERLALVCFLAYSVIAYAVVLFHFGNVAWFINDDWALIVEGIVESVFTPVQQHWSTLPILLYRSYFYLFGANFFPFLATVSGLHLGIVSLLRLIMRRAGVSPWRASLFAAVLLLFGPGYLAIIFAIEITQNFSLVFGLGQFILADHDGPVDRRDAFGLLVGALGLMCSGLGPLLVIGVGCSMIFRKRWWAAVFHTAPLGILYLAWFFYARPLTFVGPNPYSAPFNATLELEFIWHGLVESISSLGYHDAVTVAVLASVVVGLALRLSPASREGRSAMAVPLALLVCMPLYLAVVGVQRSRMGAVYAGYSHHLYTVVCFFLPAFACGADAIVRRWRSMAPLVTSLAVVIIAVNSTDSRWGARSNVFLTSGFLHQNKQRLLAVGHSRYASSALHLDPSKGAVSPWYAVNLSVGWAVEQARKGQLPKPEPVDPVLDDSIQLMFGVTDLGAPPPGKQCADHVGPLEVFPRQGEEIAIGGPVGVFNIRHSRSPNEEVMFRSAYFPTIGHLLRIELPDMHLQLEPEEGAASFVYCR